MARPQYHLIQCRSALNRVVGMPFHWSLNPYAGCTHACQYCYARAYHAYRDLGPSRDFETQIFVKTNIAEALRRDLARPAWRGESVAIGTATDPYQPAEGQFRLTRACLAVLLERRNPCSLVTKGPLIVRDRDLLADLARAVGCTVYLTITTLDPEIWRRIEPGTAPPAARLRALERLATAGVRCGVLLSPILPGITDRFSQLEAVMRAAREAGAQEVGAGLLRLGPGFREVYLEFVAREYADLAPRYRANYIGQEPPPAYTQALQARLEEMRVRVGFAPRRREREADRSLPPVRQLALPLSAP